jgi:hypothetical protein
MKEGKPASFSTSNLLPEDDYSSFISVHDVVLQHLEKLTLEICVPKTVSRNTWVRNPFNVDGEDPSDDTTNIPKLQEQLIET